MNNRDLAKEFIATNISTALRQVKLAFGPDALILSQETIGTQVRVIALPAHAMLPQAVNASASKVADDIQPRIDVDPMLSVEHDSESIRKDDVFCATYLRNPTQHQKTVVSEEVSNYIKNELASIKSLIREQHAKDEPNNEDLSQQFHVIQLTIMRTLHKSKFGSALINSIVSSIPQDFSLVEAWQFVIAKLINLIHFDKTGFSSKKIQSFIGPSGVGKSLLLAKLLIFYAARPLSKNFSIIFVNNSNLKVLEESKVYARLFGVATYYVESLEELERAYRQSIDKQYVFIDFPAYDFNCTENNFYLNFLQKHRSECDNTLVVSSHCQQHYIQRFFNAFQKTLIDGLSITKLDENNSCDEIISFLINNEVVLRNLSFGNLHFTNGYSSRLIFADKNYFQEYFTNRFLHANL